MKLLNDFQNNGFIDGINVLPKEKSVYYRKKCEAFIDSYRFHPNFSDWTYIRTELVLKWVAELASEESLLDVIEELIGPDILLWNALLPVKPPRSDSYFGWHQDATYWPVTPTEQIVSAWVALSPVNWLSGGMQMVRGSHLLGALPHEKTYDKNSMLKRGQQIKTKIDNDEVHNSDLKPGQASIHHTLTLHCSGPNQSDDWRLGVGLRYVSSQVGPKHGHEDSALPMRGNLENSKFKFNEPPQSDLDSKALENFEKVMRRESKRYSDIQEN